MSFKDMHVSSATTRVLNATLEFVRLSIRDHDESAIAEGIRTFNALGLPWVFVGIHDRTVHLTFVGERYRSRNVFSEKSRSLLWLSDVVWCLGSDGHYSVLKDRTGLYKGSYDV